MKKNQYRILTGSLVLLGTIFPTQAANRYWDGTDTGPDANGGAGTWDTSTTNWDDAATAGANVAFATNDTVFFGGTGGVVSLAAAISATGVTVNSNGYTVQDNTLTLGAGGINVASGITTTVASTLGGGFTKTGTGKLILNGANAYTGPTVVSAGTLQVGAATPNNFRYYRFQVAAKYNIPAGDGYNQMSEMAYYRAGARVLATAGTPGTSTSGEGWWNNANDNVTTSKFGTGTLPYALTYDFATPQSFNKYNWASANDSTPQRNPARWQVLASQDGTNFTILDDRTRAVQNGPTTTFTWGAVNGTYVAATNGTPNAGEPNGFPIVYRTAMPTGSPVQIASGASFDINGRDQRISSLADSAGGGGTAMSSSLDFPCTLELGGTDNTTFSGVITDQGEGVELSVVRSGSGALTMAGSSPNTYTGATIIGDMGKLILNKPAGTVAIPKDIALANGFNATGAISGLSFLQDEQIADTAKITFPATNYGGTTAMNQWVHLQGHTETVRGIVSTITNAAIENRAQSDTFAYGPARLILNVPGSESYSYAGILRNQDGGTVVATMTLGITKNGTGTQILTGNGGSATGPGVVNAGLLRLTGSYGGSMAVTGTGTLDGTGTNGGLVTVSGGGIFNTGTAGVGAFTTTGGTTIGSGGTLNVVAGSTLTSSTNPTTIATGGVATVGGTVNSATTVAGTLTSTGTIGNTLTVASGGSVNATGSVSNTLTVQAGGALTVGPAISTLVTSTTVSLGGTINMQADRTGGVITNDKLSGFTGITYGGTLNVTFTGETPLLGEGIQLFVPNVGGATFAGTFSSITGLPALGAGNQWDVSELLSTGTVRVTNTASKPAFVPAGGDYMGAVNLTITGDAGATIYYTMDGTDPTHASPSLASPATGIIVPTNSDVTVKAIASLSGFTDSAIVTNVYHTVTLPKWIVDASGDWGVTTNWDRGVTANGIDATADFTLDQTASHNVNVNLSRTVGKLVFANSQSFGWTMGSTTNSTLTLATSTGSPEIEVREAGSAVDLDAYITGPIGGTQGFTKTGAGTLGLSGNKSFGGNVAINQGMVSVDNFLANGTNSPLGTGSTMSMNGGILRYTGAGGLGFGAFNKTVTLGAGGGTLDTSTPANFWFISGSFVGPGNLTKVGARQLIVQASNTYDGQTFINEGEVQIRTPDALGSTVGNTVVANTARLAVGAGFGTSTCPENLVLTGDGGNTQGALQTNDAGVTPTFSGGITLNGNTSVGGVAAVTLTLSGPIGGTGDFTKVNNNSLVISGTAPNTWAGNFVMSGTCRILLQKSPGVNAVSGNVTLAQLTWNGNAAGLVLGANEQIPDTAVITFGGTGQESFWRLNGFNETLGGLQLGANANGVIENRGYTDTAVYPSPTITLNVTGSNSYSYNSTIRDNDVGDETLTGKINIVKNGTGTQELGGYKKNAGLMTVNAGTLILGGQNDYAGQVLVNSGATLKGTPILSPLTSATVNAGGTFAPGNNTTPIGTYTVGSAVIAGKYVCELDGVTGDRLTVANALNVTGATLDFDVINAPTANSYVIASYGTTLTGTFTVVDLPAGYVVSYDSTNKQVLLVKSGYASFASANGLTGTANDDFDGDGLANGIEYVLGTVPTANSATSAPTATVSGGNLIFTFNRADASMTPDTTVTVEVSSPLTPGSWTSYNVGATTALSSPGITVTDNGANDTITLSVAVGTDFAKFARLKVVVTGP